MKTLPLVCLLFFSLFILQPHEAYSKDSTETAGDIGQVAIPAVAAIMTVVKDDREGTIQFLKAYASALAATEVLKYSVHEQRPNGGQHSFPSGHTVSAFAGAAFIQERYGWAEGIPAYLAASFVGYSRVESKNHHWSDVFAGAVVGVVPNLIFTSAYKDVAVVPVAGNGFLGLMIGTRF